jgi:pimeloyl-ACP methyl ester carboxylesterase
MSEKFENLSVNEVFKDRKVFIPEVGMQLRRKMEAEIETVGKKVKIDYRIISVSGKEKGDVDPVILLPGFGSGWEGISELGFSLACEGRKVVMPSLPGYGNSDNPPREYYAMDNFSNEAEAVGKFLEQLDLEGKKAHLVGHSMGSEILASVAEKYPEKVSSLVLLNPAGVEKDENSALLASKFLLSGAQTNMEYKIKTMLSGEEDYEKELGEYISETKSPFAADRMAQRLAEAKKVSKGHLLEKIKKIKIPITYISGELDTVYPPGKKDDVNSQLAKIIEGVGEEEKIEKSVMAGLRHNTTIAPDEITAANIEHYLEKAEKTRKTD